MIQIIVEGGVVQEVYSSDKEEYVEVIDLDNEPDKEDYLFDNMYMVY